MPKLFTKVAAIAKVLPKGKRNRLDLARFLVRRPAVMLAVGAYEVAVLTSSRTDDRIKSLAVLKTSSLVGCPY